MTQFNWEDKTILVVDDKDMNYVLLRTQLRKTKATVIWLVNGSDAYEYVKKGNKVDLILMDIRMPVMDGIEASRMIKEIYPQLPIVIQTASVMGNAFEEIATSKCDDTIYKPIDAVKLIEIIANQFEKYATK
jgi:two-component system, cell cycle response regulator DivK